MLGEEYVGLVLVVCAYLIPARSGGRDLMVLRWQLALPSDHLEPDPGKGEGEVSTTW